MEMFDILREASMVAAQAEIAEAAINDRLDADYAALAELKLAKQELYG
jgi:hypothetical protein